MNPFVYCYFYAVFPERVQMQSRSRTSSSIAVLQTKKRKAQSNRPFVWVILSRLWQCAKAGIVKTGTVIAGTGRARVLALEERAGKVDLALAWKRELTGR